MPDINKEVLFKTLEYTTSSTAENSTFLVTSASSNEYAINVYISAVGKGSLRFYIQNDSVLRIEANIQSGNWKYALDNTLDNDNANHKFYIETPTETEITFRTEILYGQLEAILPALSSTTKTKTEIQNGYWVSAENCNDLNIKNDLTVGNNVTVERDLYVAGAESKITGNVTVSQGNLTVSGNLSMNDANSTIQTSKIENVKSIQTTSITMGANSSITTSTITGASTISASTISATSLNGTANITNLNIPTSSDLNVSNLNMTGENSNINVSGNVTASTLSINNLESSNIRIIGSNGVTISGNTRVVGNLTINGEITGQITQEQNALAGISSNTSIASENISEITITLDEQTNNKYFYADDTSKSKSYKVNINSKPIYDTLSNQNTTLTGLINTNKENISNLTTSLNTHKDQLTNANSAHYSDVYATTFHGALAGNATSATSLQTSAGSATMPIYFSDGKPVECSETLSLTAAAASALTTSTAGNASLPVYFSGGIPVSCSTTLDVSITGNAVSINTSKYNSSNGTIYFTGMTKFNGENQTPVVISELDFDGTNIHANNCNLFLKSVDAAESINTQSMTVTEINGHTPFTLIQNSDGSKSYTYDTLTTKFSNIDTQLKEAGKIDKIVLNNDELAITDKSVSINISKSTNNGNIKVNNKDITIYTLPTASSTAYGGVMVDSSLSDTSANPVENKVIADFVNKLTSRNYGDEASAPFENIYAGLFHGNLDGYASSVCINENSQGTNYEYIPIMCKYSNNTGIFTSVKDLKYITSTNTLNANNINVSNNIKASTINVSNNIVVTGSIQAAYFNATSDKRLKTNIEKLPITLKACETINNLDLYTFNYKNNLEERSLGIMAQDIENLNIDGFNFTNKDSDGYLSIKESKLVYLLMAAIKEQNKKIEELEERIKSLEE